MVFSGCDAAVLYSVQNTAADAARFSHYYTFNLRFEPNFSQIVKMVLLLLTPSFLRVITLWFLVLSQFFRDGSGPFKGQK